MEKFKITHAEEMCEALKIDNKEHFKKLDAIKKSYKAENTITKKINEEMKNTIIEFENFKKLIVIV